jgi:hypothetical protein
MTSTIRRAALFLGILAGLGFTWVPAGSPGARFWHGATLLASGRVLVAGGQGESGDSLASAVLFEAPSTWIPAGSMAQARNRHSQTRLKDGRVLVAGGHPGVLASAEIYDPVTNAWSAAAPMNVARAQHTASLLPDGRVLVVGGIPGGLIGLSDVEIYDPIANAWTVAAPLNFGRYDHAAVPLTDGRVLIVGGTTGAEQISTTEIYDPQWNFWMLSGWIYHRRQNPTAVQLDNGKVLVAGGLSFDPAISTAELIDVQTGMTTITAEMLADRYNHGWAKLADGRVLLAGGTRPGGGTYSSAELYDPATDTWKDAGSLSGPRFFHTVTALPDGRAVMAGGLGTDPLPTTAELWTSQDVVAPVITVVPLLTVEQTGPGGAPAAIPATAVDDVDGPVPVTSDAPAIFPPGFTTVHLTASDRAGNVATATMTVLVTDTLPPMIQSASANPASLWPAKNQMVPVTIAVQASDVADPAPVSRITGVAGGSSADYQITGPLTVSLRAVKNTSRTYTVTVTCTDAAGNKALRSVTVRVERPQ